MAEYLTNDTDLTAVANAIRTKGGTSASLEYPNGYIAAINAIPTGGTPTPPETPTDAVIFYSIEPFTLHTQGLRQRWNGTLEYSTDYSSWNTWSASSILSAAQSDSWYKLYIRGRNNTTLSGNGVSSSNWVLSGTRIITCSGNLGNLMNYNGTITLANYAMAFLFQYSYNVYFDNITLPMTSLADYCYEYMFQYSGIIKAPDLPAPTVPNSAYYGMFYHSGLRFAPKISATSLGDQSCRTMLSYCYSLGTLPSINATSFGVQACYGMFNNSNLIKMSSTQTGAYQTPYRIPTDGSGVVGTNSLQNMFQNTGGTFTGTPTINTTYYTSNTVIS